MPLYEFACDNCGMVFESIIDYKNPIEFRCVYCNENTKRLFSPPSSYIGPKTLGSLAEYNNNKMSDEAKALILGKDITKPKKTWGLGSTLKKRI